MDGENHRLTDLTKGKLFKTKKKSIVDYMYRQICYSRYYMYLESL